jgi:hypothetical protein
MKLSVGLVKTLKDLSNKLGDMATAKGKEKEKEKEKEEAREAEEEEEEEKRMTSG